MAAAASRGRAVFKFLFWTASAIGLFIYAVHAHTSGKLAEWYYHTAATDGYAVNANDFNNASPESPMLLKVTKTGRIEGLIAVPVRKGDRLPVNANGVLSAKILAEGKRARLETGAQGDQIKMMVPWKIEMAKGFKFKDTFKHKGIETYPWAGVWNVLMVMFIGLSLGFMAEGFTDVLGIRLEKIRHFEGH